MDTQFSTRLEQALKHSGKERQELAAALGISVQALSHVFIGKTKALTAENTAKAGRFLGVDLYWLATGEGKPDGSQPVPQVSQRTEPYNATATTDEIIELIALYQQASERGRSNILDLARSAVKQNTLRWRRVANES
ncbi:helix-turn-helix domain-containing protein [Oxalicibacterium faecigallinarum]|uniref:HTH cro/C1-type domain-containing protein n=1 Tax=Oxalicibacterium faecigallinarum TaxID=573741 RepID=A0A8J3AL32_9BURK|nr:helix-turn-helix transcriptional regulator [Oxalicibacterium faecigallinarum]GGI16408.1 hypothetical protein GCM10008066_03810 [Oxalicibacterium faecigallinarum]